MADTAKPKMLYGVTMDDDDDLGDFLDFLDAAAEGDIQIIAWSRNSTHKMIVLSTVAIKSEILDEYDSTTIRPPGQLQESMGSNANEWISPGSLVEAQEMLSSMKRQMWADIESLAASTVPPKAAEKPAKAPQSVPTGDGVASSASTPSSEFKKKPAAPLNAPSRMVLEAFNIPLEGLKDSDGNVIQLGTLSRDN